MGREVNFGTGSPLKDTTIDVAPADAGTSTQMVT